MFLRAISQEEETIRKELSSCLEPMVKELPDKYREAVQLSELENKTQKEIAELENISNFATNYTNYHEF